MTERIIDLSDDEYRLTSRNGLLVLAAEAHPEVTVPFADIAALIVAHPHVTYSQSVLSGLAEAGASFIACNDRRMPAAMLMPLQANYIQSERFARQAVVPKPCLKRLWKQIVSTKIKMQALALRKLGRPRHEGLLELSKQVKSGDTENLEGRAARTYWAILFGNSFRRDFDAHDQNRFLNYGYAIVRSIVSRAICASGLHPSLGIHHHNRYNPFCLADDLMEPFRPLVDVVVAGLLERHDAGAPLDKNLKSELIAPLLKRYRAGSESRTLFDLASKMTESLVRVYEEKDPILFVPEIAL